MNGEGRFCAKLAAALVLCAATGFMPRSYASPLPFDSSSYAYHANDTPLVKMLTEFCSNFGIQLQMDTGIATRMSGRLGAPSASEFLNTVTASSGLDWFYYAGTVYVTRVTERDTQAHAISRESIPGLKRALLDLKVLDERFGWATLPEQGMVVVTGPPAYLDLVAKTMRTVQAAPTGQQMVVWKLKYANVEDRQVTVRDKTTLIPGIKSLLQALGGSRSDVVVKNANGQDSVSRLESLKPAPSIGGGGAASPPSGSSLDAGAAGGQGATPTLPAGAAETTAPGRPQLLSGRGVTIEADVRLNAIVMKGPADLIAGYQALIAALDTPVGLVEIEAITIDVNKSRLEELGIDWSANLRNVSAGFGVANQPVAPGVLSLGYRGAAAATTVVADQASALLARIRFLETTGDAYVAGKPSILTSDNLSALIDLSQTFYTKVTGERVANLTPVTVGVMLKVSPRIVTTEAGQTEIQLVIDIEDGALVDRTGLDLPVVQRTTISTQATILEGQSLLIGGYDTETQQNSMEKVPLLGDIPKLGALFRSTRVDQQRRKRMFLITPRIVSMGAPTLAIARSTQVPTEAMTLQPLVAKPEPAAPPPPPPTLSSTAAALENSTQEAETAAIRRAITAWAEAWSRRDITRYLDAYSADFTPANGQSRQDWAKDRRARIEQRKFIRVRVSQLQVELKQSDAHVRFEQSYESDGINATNVKILELSNSGGRWLIVRERAL